MVDRLVEVSVNVGKTEVDKRLVSVGERAVLVLIDVVTELTGGKIDDELEILVVERVVSVNGDVIVFVSDSRVVLNSLLVFVSVGAADVSVDFWVVCVSDVFVSVGTAEVSVGFWVVSSDVLAVSVGLRVSDVIVPEVGSTDGVVSGTVVILVGFSVGGTVVGTSVF